MLTFVDSLDARKVTVYQDTHHPEILYLAPHELQLVTHANGKPAFSLLFVGKQTFVTLETAWSIENVIGQSESARIEQWFQERSVTQGNSQWRFQAPPISRSEAKCFYKEEGQPPIVLHETTTSNFGDFRATFQFALPPEKAEIIENSLSRGGNSDILVCYELHADAGYRVKIVWQVDVGKAKSFLSETSKPEDILSRLPILQREGLVKVTMSPQNSGSKEISSLSYQMAKLLIVQLQNQTSGSLTLSQEATHPSPLKFNPMCSLSKALTGISPETYLLK